MIVGNGLLAKNFQKYKEDDNIIIFASGVSNSNETSKEAFKREKDLLRDTMITQKDKILVYFSSCDVIYADKLKKLYYYHKLEMEKIIKKDYKKYFIFRLPQLIGKSSNTNSLINYIINSILNDKEIFVWKNAYKNLIGISEVKIMAEFFIENEKSNKTVNLINKNYYSILEIIQTLENYLSKKAIIVFMDKGFKPDYKITNISNKLDIDFDNEYLKKSIEITYGRKNKGIF